MMFEDPRYLQTYVPQNIHKTRNKSKHCTWMTSPQSRNHKTKIANKEKNQLIEYQLQKMAKSKNSTSKN